MKLMQDITSWSTFTVWWKGWSHQNELGKDAEKMSKTKACKRPFTALTRLPQMLVRSLDIPPFCHSFSPTPFLSVKAVGNYSFGDLSLLFPLLAASLIQTTVGIAASSSQAGFLQEKEGKDMIPSQTCPCSASTPLGAGTGFVVPLKAEQSLFYSRQPLSLGTVWLQGPWALEPFPQVW